MSEGEFKSYSLFVGDVDVRAYDGLAVVVTKLLTILIFFILLIARKYDGFSLVIDADSNFVCLTFDFEVYWRN